MKQKDLLNLNVEDFYHIVRTGEVSTIETINYIQAITDNYDLSKLEYLLSDIEFYKYIDNIEQESKFRDQTSRLMNEYEEKGKELPIFEVEGLDGRVHKALIFDLEKEFYPHYFFLIDRIIGFIKKKIDSTGNKEISKQKKGFQSKLPPAKIERLYKQMQGNYFDTSLENFEAIFNPNHTNFTPIKRTKKFTNSLLIHFASELFQKENPFDYVSITEYCFKTKNLSQSQNNYIQYTSNHKPRGFQEIDKIIQSIYTPLQ